MDDAAWNGDEPADALPPAPVPSHERAWRHPSELGRAQHALVETRSISRGVLIAVGTVGLLGALLLARAVVPRDRSGVASGAEPTRLSQPSVPASASASGSESGSGSTAVMALSEAVDFPSERTVARFREGVGLVWMDGRHVATAADVGPAGTTTSVSVPSGDVVDGIVLSVDEGVTVVELVTPGAAATFQLAPPASSDTSRPVESDSTTTDSVDPSGLGTANPGRPVTIAVLDGPAIAATLFDDGRLVPVANSLVTTTAKLSGTPVVDRQGTVLGLFCLDGPNEMRLMPLDRIDEMIASADGLGSWLGVHSSATEEAAVDRVAPGSPAADAGVRAGDVVLSVDGAAVASVRDVRGRLRLVAPGDDVTLRIRRGDDEIDVTVVVATPPDPTAGPSSTTASVAAVTPRPSAPLGDDVVSSTAAMSIPTSSAS